MLDLLPPSLQQLLLLEWLSPETVWTLARASGVLRRAVLASPCEFRAADGTIVSDGCLRWFQEHGVPLRPWTYSKTLAMFISHYSNGKLYREIWNDGTQEWFQHGKLHRDCDLPAYIRADGTQYWYQNHELHRDGDRPAVVRPNEIQEWWQHGKEHRDGDKPAVVSASGTRLWYKHGEQHRDGDKPAVVWADGSQEWYQHGKRHRAGGRRPAVIWVDGTQMWYHRGVQVK